MSNYSIYKPSVSTWSTHVIRTQKANADTLPLSVPQMSYNLKIYLLHNLHKTDNQRKF